MDGNSLTFEQLSQLATGNTKVEIAEHSWARINDARKIVNRLSVGEESYFGINTGVGIFTNVKIKEEDMEEF